MYGIFARSFGAGLRGAKILWVALLIGLGLPGGISNAQTAETGALGELTLGRAIERTLAHNPELAVFQLRDQAMAGRLKTAGLKPPVTLGAELENFAGSRSNDDVELTVALSSVIELGGKRAARVGTVYAARDLLLAQEQAKALDLLGEVIRRFAEVLASRERSALASQAVALARDTLHAVSLRVAAAAAPQSEQLRAEAALADARLMEAAERRRLVTSKRALAVLWGEPDARFMVDSSALYRLEPISSFETLFSLAQQNPAIASFAAEGRLRAAELRLAETQSILDVGWSVGVRRAQEFTETSLVAAVEVPMFAAQRNAGAVQTAMAEREMVALRKQAALLHLNQQLFRAVSARKQAVATVDVLYQSTIPKLKQALTEVERAYRRGRYSYVEWVAAREELLRAQRVQIEAARAALRFGAEIEQMTAVPMQAGSATTSEKVVK